MTNVKTAKTALTKIKYYEKIPLRGHGKIARSPGVPKGAGGEQPPVRGFAAH